MAQTYSFPILSDQELLPCLKDMELPLSAAQLSKPTYDIVRPVYESVVQSLMGVSREELQQPVFSALDTLEYPEMHDESIPFLAFTKRLSQLMAATGVKDFSLQDLCKPEPARLRRNLSAVINFAKFREEKLVPYTEMQEQTIGLLETAERLQEGNAQLAAELSKLQAAREAEKTEVEAVEATINEVHSENQALNRQQISLTNEARALKNQTNTLTTKAADVKFQLQTSKQRAERLRSQIVESPEKLEAALNELQQAIDRERMATAEAERRARDLQSKLDAISRVEKDVQKAAGAIDEAAAELARKKEASRRAKALRAEISGHEADASQLAAEHHHLQRQIAALQERLQRFENQCELRKAAAVSAVEEQRSDKEAIQAENAVNLARLAEDEAAMRKIRQRSHELHAAHEAEVGAALDSFQRLRRQVLAHDEALEAAMGLSDFTGQLSALRLAG